MYRVQMVKDGVPAYQNDIAHQVLAMQTAEQLAGGKVPRVASTTDILRFEDNTTLVRVFDLVHAAVSGLHTALKARWEAAGSPAHSTEPCLWDLQRWLDAPRSCSAKGAVTEATELLCAWISNGDAASAEETAALQLVTSTAVLSRLT